MLHRPRPESGGKTVMGRDRFQREKRLIHGGHKCHGSHMTDTTITAFSPVNTSIASCASALANNTKKIYHHIQTFLSFLYPNEAFLRRQVFTLAQTRGSLGLTDY